VPELELTDDDLMRLFADGDDDAFQALFDRHFRAVYNFANSMLNNPQRAQDVLQETFLTVVRSAQRYEPRGHFRTWLLRICRNRCLNLLESDRVRREALRLNGLTITEHD
jgi:RNA polymerase sigma-70 factor (ECF subfamily)